LTTDLHHIKVFINDTVTDEKTNVDYLRCDW